MNPRQVTQGLPGKSQYTQGPAPPLPAGPPPAQTNAYGQTPEQAAAHAAAWAAYYQSQGMAQPASYTAPASSTMPPAGAPNANNPYANYGYGPNAQHTKAPNPTQPYRPPVNTQAYATTSTQPSLGFQQPQTQPQSQPHPQAQVYGQQQYPQGYQAPYQPVTGAPQQAYGWGQPQPQQQAFRPPQQQVQQAHPQAYPGYSPQPTSNYGHQAAPFTPPPQQAPYRPPMSGPGPSPAQAGNNSPFRPPNPHVQNQRPPRPPTNQPGQGVAMPIGASGFPPAKRPRFDGPGGDNDQNRMNNSIRPQLSGPAPGFNAPPAGPGGHRNVSNRGPLVSRPPIHLGRGGPPSLGFPSVSAGKGPVARGGDRPARGRGGGPMNAPRGPANMRRSENFNPPSGPGQFGKMAQKDAKKEAGGKKKKEKELKGTMTDFRIIGVEFGGLGWGWGVVNGKVLGADEGESDSRPDIRFEAQLESETENQPESRLESQPRPELELENGNDDKPEGVEAHTESDTENCEDEEADEEVKAEKEPIDALENHCHASEDKSKGDVTVKTEHVSHDESQIAPVGNESVEPFEGVVSSAPAASAAEAADEKEKEKRGEKRKAKSPDAEDEAHPQKRTAYILTHKKPNVPATSAPSGLSGQAGRLAKYESNSNRFRIYFDSPPELDRAPKAAKKAANSATQNEKTNGKRWRRDSTASIVLEKAKENIVSEDVEGEKDVVAESHVDARIQSVGGDAEHPPEEQKSLNRDQAGDEQELKADASVEQNLVEGSPTSPEVAAEVVEPLAATTVEDIPQAGQPKSEQVVKQEVEIEKSLDGDLSMATQSKLITDTVGSSMDDAPLSSVENAQPACEGDKIKNPEDEPSKNESSTELSVQPEPTKSETNPEERAEQDSSNPDIAAAMAEAFAASASNAASAYKSRARRQSSVSTNSDHPSTSVSHPSISKGLGGGAEGASWNRLSIVWEDSLRRLCLDVEVVERVRMWRSEGRIEVELKPHTAAGDEEAEEASQALPKGILLEVFDQAEQRFIPYTAEHLAQLHSSPTPDTTVPPMHLVTPDMIADGAPLTVTVYLNQKSPLSEPKWVKNNQADAWLYEQFESRKGVDAGWRGKLEVMDPDPVPTLQNILDNWASNCALGTPSSRRAFVSSLSSSPNDLLEILLRLARGERNPTLGSSSTPSFGPLAALIRPDSPFASHQTHVSLAILAMYRLTTDYAQKAGESVETVEEKVGDIVRSLPVMLITKSLDGLFKEWQGNDGK